MIARAMVAFYSLLLRIGPPELVTTHGSEMERVFRELLAQERRHRG